MKRRLERIYYRFKSFFMSRWVDKSEMDFIYEETYNPKNENKSTYYLKNTKDKSE